MCSHKYRARTVLFLLTLCLVFPCLTVNGRDYGESVISSPNLQSGLLESNTNRHVHPFASEPVESDFSTEDFEKTGETNCLEIYLNREEAALRIRNKETGYLWGALPIKTADGLNTTWRCYGNGLVSIECFNKDGAESRVSIGKNGVAEYTIREDGMLCSVLFQEYGIAFEVMVSWEGSQITFQLVEGSVREGLDGSPYLLKSMTFLPFFGSSYSDSIDGYMLIPDGSGALIRYRKPGNYSSTYAERIYGADYGIASISSTAGNYARPEAEIAMPVYGMVHGARQNGFLAVVEEGAEYAGILATPAQTNNPYNWAAARFEFRQKYVKSINRKDGAGANVPQEEPNRVTPQISFYFLSGESAHYDGMAVRYRQMLVDQGVLTPLQLDKSDVPLQLEILGADKKYGFLWDGLTVYTTVQQANEIRRSLESHGITNPDMVYLCYTANNECGRPLLRRVGKLSELQMLAHDLEKTGGALYLYMDPVTANSDQINLRTEAAGNLSKKEIKWTEPSGLIAPPERYLYRLSEAGKRIEKSMAYDYEIPFATAQLTGRLYSDFTTGKEVSRSDSLVEVRRLISQLSSGGKMPMYRPNRYLWDYADKMYNLPIGNSQIMYESDSVPFLQIVLSGCVEMFGESINTSLYARERLLRQIEYGMAPKFIVTACESAALYHTNQEKYFSTCYADWEPWIVEAHQVIAEALAAVWGSSMISHDCLKTGVVRVGYENGVQIYLNYTDREEVADGVAIPAGWFVVAKSGREVRSGYGQ